MKRVALALLAVALVATLSFAKDKAPKSQKVAGWIVDEKCSKKDKGPTSGHFDCTKKCMDAGEKLVLVSDKDKKILQIDNQDAVKEHAGHHVTVTGPLTGDSIHVNKINMGKQPKAAEQKGEH